MTTYKYGIGGGKPAEFRFQKSPMTVVMPGVPNLRLLRAINSLPSGRCSNAVTFSSGNWSLASMETEPVQKPMSQNDFFPLMSAY